MKKATVHSGGKKKKYTETKDSSTITEPAYFFKKDLT